MSPHQIVAVAARLIAVWMVIHLPGQVYAFFDSDAKLNDPKLRLLALGVAAIEVIVILVLWFFPHTIARKLLKSSSTEIPPPSSADSWLQIGCALLGLWLVATSLPALLLDTFLLSTANSGDTSTLLHSVFYYLAEVGIGVWLILGANGFRQVVWWARNAGIGELMPGEHRVGINCLSFDITVDAVPLGPTPPVTPVLVPKSSAQFVLVTGSFVPGRTYYTRCVAANGQPRAWLADAPNGSDLPPGFASVCTRGCPQ